MNLAVRINKNLPNYYSVKEIAELWQYRKFLSEPQFDKKEIVIFEIKTRRNF